MYEAILDDSVDRVSSLIENNEFTETFISKVPPDSPTIMNQNPPLTCVAAYYGSLECLQYFLDNGYDLFTPDDIFLLIIIKFQIIFQWCFFI